MNERDKQWRKWFDEAVGSTRNEELLYQCWTSAWERSQEDVSAALDRLLASSEQIMEIGKTPSK
jgi:hypothetical protein